jgi:hypothetical protein
VILAPSNHARYRERLDLWHAYARHVSGVLQVAQDLREGRLGRDDDWAAIGAAPIWNETKQSWQRFLRATGRTDGWPVAETHVIELVVNQWVIASGLIPFLSWEKGAHPQVRLGGGLIAGALALRLLNAISGPDVVARCSGCGKWYSPSRRPRADRANYCSRCRADGTADRLRKRDQRARPAGTREAQR